MFSYDIWKSILRAYNPHGQDTFLQKVDRRKEKSFSKCIDDSEFGHLSLGRVNEKESAICGERILLLGREKQICALQLGLFKDD